MHKVHKILVIKLRAIGDVVLSTSVLPSLRSAYPNSEIHFLVETSGKDVVEDNPNVDRIVILPRKEWERLSGPARFRENIRFIKELRSFQYDLVFDLFGNPRSAILTLFSGARTRIGFAFRGRKIAYTHKVTPRGAHVHEVEFNLDALRHLDIPIVSKSPCFPIKPTNRQMLQDWLNDKGLKDAFLIGIHAWGSWDAKRWELEKFARLADHLIRIYQAKIILLWGPGEKEYARQVQAYMKHPACLAPETSLKELGGLISLCHLIVANDSGPMHIAAAVGTPTVGIFGPTHYQLQGPYGPQHGVAYKKDLICLGCNRLECKERTCMDTLEVEDVLEVIKSILNKPVRKFKKLKVS